MCNCYLKYKKIQKPLDKGDFLCYNNYCWCKVNLRYTYPERRLMNDNIVLLLDFYGDLLPKSQQTALDLRLNSDLSLGEIAEEMGGISRQSVNDFLKKGKHRLIELEEILGNARRFLEVSTELENMKSALSGLPENLCEPLNAAVDRINKIMRN